MGEIVSGFDSKGASQFPTGRNTDLCTPTPTPALPAQAFNFTGDLYQIRLQGLGILSHFLPYLVLDANVGTKLWRVVS